MKEVTAKTTVYNLDGSAQYTHSDNVTAAPSAATDVGAVAFPDGLSPVHFVKLELRDGKGRLLSDNFYWRAAPDDQDNFRALNSLPTVALDIQAKRNDSGGQCRLEVVMRNPSKAIALMSHICSCARPAPVSACCRCSIATTTCRCCPVRARR